jgi:transaldolase
MPDKTLKALADHGRIGTVMPADGGDAEDVIAGFRVLGIDDDAVAARLQDEAAASFSKSWQSLLAGLRAKTLKLAGDTDQGRPGGLRSAPG